ncbi:MAG: SulP family sulfate permease, partial [Paracoccaceae bacterium]
MTKTAAPRWTKVFPILTWGRAYDGTEFTGDMMAAVIVTIMLVPQSLAYALLAGLPAEIGLYASILPLAAYAIFGTSRALAVGPVAVASLMTASALAPLGLETMAQYIAAAAVLAAMSGFMLLAMGALRLGVIANFLSHPVIAGFITASGILIATSQMKHLLGISAGGHNLIEMLYEIVLGLPKINIPTVLVSTAALGLLLWVRKGLAPMLQRFGVSKIRAQTAARVGPVFAIVGTIFAAWALNLSAMGVNVVGTVPTGSPPFGLPEFDMSLLSTLALPALLISVIGYVESVSVAQTLAAKRRQQIDPNQELIALGASNVASAFSGGYPVTGGFSRSVVNFDAGARTPAAGA